MGPTKCALLAVSAVISIALLVGTAQADIKATTILFRHGQRTPASPLPNIPCTMCDDMGYGQLTKAGSREMYENGVMLRLKYLHLFPKSGYFRMKNMHIISSASERCIMSLQSFMAGFFPPPLADLPFIWQPFTHEIDYAGRILYFNPSPASCPVFFQHIYKVMQSPPAEYANWLNTDRAILNDVSSRLGVPINDLADALQVSDSVKTQMTIDPTMPQWLTDAYKSTLYKYNELMKGMFHLNDEMIKIRGGPMVTEILKNMEAVANGDPAGKEFVLYSAHDQTLASLAYALNVIKQIPEPISYSDTIMVDLVSNKPGEWMVEVIYMDNAKTIPKRINLNVPGCGVSCSLATFRNAVKNVLVTDFNKLCGL